MMGSTSENNDLINPFENKACSEKSLSYSIND